MFVQVNTASRKRARSQHKFDKAYVDQITSFCITESFILSEEAFAFAAHQAGFVRIKAHVHRSEAFTETHAHFTGCLTRDEQTCQTAECIMQKPL